MRGGSKCSSSAIKALAWPAGLSRIAPARRCNARSAASTNRRRPRPNATGRCNAEWLPRRCRTAWRCRTKAWSRWVGCSSGRWEGEEKSRPASSSSKEGVGPGLHRRVAGNRRNSAASKSASAAWQRSGLDRERVVAQVGVQPAHAVLAASAEQAGLPLARPTSRSGGRRAPPQRAAPAAPGDLKATEARAPVLRSSARSGWWGSCRRGPAGPRNSRRGEQFAPRQDSGEAGLTRPPEQWSRSRVPRLRPRGIWRAVRRPRGAATFHSSSVNSARTSSRASR